ncbi:MULTISPECIES: CDP-alcohol phosphatidyltransferase family protein [Rhodomicrobium]|uniref:CDP-alcohol phosphatidyltransferase family protein n=1 Tax=Rhodomicrobium TaxID=1068 RepID=UPI000B4BB583|nr:MULTISPECIES: CDP-alcohol phosphatidyltransferase family protein [Rhodomicrobium]
MQLVYLPNIITVSRLFLVPVIIWMIVANELLAAFIVFLTAGLTDALDGFLARRFNWQTELGAYLDPVADKALLMGVYAVLGFYGHLPAWLVILVVSRDVLIIGAVMLSWLLHRTVAVHPLMISKINTAMQIGLAVLVLAEGGLQIGLGPYIFVLIWTTGLTTALSAGIYLVIWMRRMASYDIDERLKKSGPQPGTMN